MTARDESASFRIFSTLNSRGVDLSEVDKLKADLLQVRRVGVDRGHVHLLMTRMGGEGACGGWQGPHGCHAVTQSGGHAVCGVTRWHRQGTAVDGMTVLGLRVIPVTMMCCMSHVGCPADNTVQHVPPCGFNMQVLEPGQRAQYSSQWAEMENLLGRQQFHCVFGFMKVRRLSESLRISSECTA